MPESTYAWLSAFLSWLFSSCNRQSLLLLSFQYYFLVFLSSLRLNKVLTSSIIVSHSLHHLLGVLSPSSGSFRGHPCLRSSYPESIPSRVYPILSLSYPESIPSRVHPIRSPSYPESIPDLSFSMPTYPKPPLF